MSAAPVLDRPRPALLDYESIVNGGALVGKAKVRHQGLEIADIGIFQKDGRTWAQLPAEPLRDYQTGQILKDERGKTRYRSSLRWQTRDLQDRFSKTLIALIEAAHPGALDGAPP